MALDERRAYFRQNVWKEPARSGQDIKQVWFPGVHCDVGGGYVENECGLSKIALKWMLVEIGSQLTFQSKSIEEMLPDGRSDLFAAPSPTAKIHESLRGLWHLAELIPKRINVRQDDGSWAKRWIIPRGHRRKLSDGAIIHPSVYERMRLDTSYRPPNLPGGGASTAPGPVPQGT